MSRLGSKPLPLASAVQGVVSGALVTLKGPKGELSLTLPSVLKAELKDKQLVVTRADDSRQSKSFHGLFRGILASMAEGVEKGYSRDLEIQGVGFKADLKGDTLSLNLGFSSPVVFIVPAGIKVAVDQGIRLKVSGVDKQKVGEVAARIRAFFPAEPYKGKGIRYVGERVRRKVGKTVA